MWDALQNYFLSLTWLPADAPETRRGVTWSELVMDFEVSQQCRIQRWTGVSALRAKGPLTLAQRALLFAKLTHTFTQRSGEALWPGSGGLVYSLSGLGGYCARGLHRRPAFLGGDLTAKALQSLRAFFRARGPTKTNSLHEYTPDYHVVGAVHPPGSESQGVAAEALSAARTARQLGDRPAHDLRWDKVTKRFACHGPCGRSWTTRPSARRAPCAPLAEVRTAAQLAERNEKSEMEKENEVAKGSASVVHWLTAIGPVKKGGRRVKCDRCMLEWSRRSHASATCLQEPDTHKKARARLDAHKKAEAQLEDEDRKDRGGGADEGAGIAHQLQLQLLDGERLSGRHRRRATRATPARAAAKVQRSIEKIGAAQVYDQRVGESGVDVADARRRARIR